MRKARLPKRKTLAEYDFDFPKRIPKATILRLFDCDFIQRHGCAVFIGPTGTGKSHLINALGYTACRARLFDPLRAGRVVEMINHLTTAQMNGLLGKALKFYVRPSLLLLDELAYLPIDKRGIDCCSGWSLPVMKPDRSCSPRIDPSGNGAPCSKWTTNWHRP